MQQLIKDILTRELIRQASLLFQRTNGIVFAQVRKDALGRYIALR